MSHVEDDQYSDVQDTFEDERYEDLPRGIQQVELHRPDKSITITSGDHDKDGNPLSEHPRGPSISSTAEQAMETASTRSLPTVTVSQHLAAPELDTPRTVTSTVSAAVPPPSPARSQNSSHPSTVATDDRRTRRRSVTDVRVCLFPVVDPPS